MVFMNKREFNWNHFLQPYELAVEGFILKIEGIKKQYQLRRSYSDSDMRSYSGLHSDYKCPPVLYPIRSHRPY